MAQPSQASNLEDTLRQMILSNVRIGEENGRRDDAAPTTPRQRPNTRGGRRGRGDHGQNHYTLQQAADRDAHGRSLNFQDSSNAPGQGNNVQRPTQRGGFAQSHASPQGMASGGPPFHNQQFNRVQQVQRGDYQPMPPRTPPGHGYQPRGNPYGQPGPAHYGSPGTVRPVGTFGYQYDNHMRNQPPPGAKLWSSSPQQVEHPRFNNTHSQPHPIHVDSRPPQFGPDRRWKYLEEIANRVIPEIEITPEELESKNTFRQYLEAAFQSVQTEGETTVQKPMSVQIFGSLRSGFATKGSDMDLVIVDNMGSDGSAHISMREEGLARRLEKYLLGQGIGARLLTRARVPIIKVCESPPPDLLLALQEARAKWDDLPEDEKYDESNNKKSAENQDQRQETLPISPGTTTDQQSQDKTVLAVEATSVESPSKASSAVAEKVAMPENGSQLQTGATASGNHPPKRFLREKKRGPLDFPKDGVGIQCDINFFNPLGLHNTQMLYCYSLCDSRVQPMIMFVKAWAKKRKINSPYSGTLSSYGYVMMVLHYLVNVARPPVLPNLQLEAHKMKVPMKIVEGWEVHFWNDDAAIKQAGMLDRLSRNNESLGALLTGFFQYYATSLSGRGFVWMKDVLSLRTPGGLLTKEEKGWTGAKTETVDKKEIRHRYLFAVEDPFELTHNVARTVTHHGVVAIRDEFRRAWRILGAVWKDRISADGELMEELVEHSAEDV